MSNTLDDPEISRRFSSRGRPPTRRLVINSRDKFRDISSNGNYTPVGSCGEYVRKKRGHDVVSGYDTRKTTLFARGNPADYYAGSWAFLVAGRVGDRIHGERRRGRFLGEGSEYPKGELSS